MNILSPLDMLPRIYSCTKLLSWYSSTAISTNLSSYVLAISVFSNISFFSFFFINICKAKCSISLKSIMFFSFFLVANRFINSITIFCNCSKTGYIFSISFIASFELQNKIFPELKFIFFLISSLIFFAFSFISNVIFLSIGHFSHLRFCINS